MKFSKKYFIITVISAALLAISCGSETFNIRANDKEDNYFIIWSHSDIQPRSDSEKTHYETAVNDVSNNFKSIDMALFAGDIVQKSKFEEIFNWYLDTRSKAPVKEWYDIAGNHEWRAIELYKKMINKNLYYSIERGNILILMISNEQKGRKTFVSDETFRWWAEKVKKNQDKIIITVTHGVLPKNGLAAAKLDRLSIDKPQRFQEILKKYRVDIWISGHSHFPSWLPGTVNTNKNPGGTTFVDNGAIRDDFMTTIESRFLIFREGENSAVLKTRDHNSGRFRSGDYFIPLSHPFTKK
jgi:predicted phosphodiesterase